MSFPDAVGQLMAQRSAVPRVHAPHDGGRGAGVYRLRGKQVMYWGRNGEQHVEWFPGAKT